MDLAEQLAATLLTWPVIVYVLVVIAGQAVLAWLWRTQRRTRREKRAQQGLPATILLDHHERLGVLRREALIEAGVLLATVFVTPLVLVALLPEESVADRGLGLAFAILLLWLLLSGTDLLRAFLGGLAFRVLLAIRRPFQVGDRVTLMGHSGKVARVGVFHLALETPGDDLVSLPTAALWGEPLVSANAGARGSLCTMQFYLAPYVSKAQRRRAEDLIWDAMQSSTYLDFAKPMQIYLAQTPESIQLTARAYVASTYDDPLFTSDVTRAFLDAADDENIPLAAEPWRTAQAAIVAMTQTERSSSQAAPMAGDPAP